MQKKLCLFFILNTGLMQAINLERDLKNLTMKLEQLTAALAVTKAPALDEFAKLMEYSNVFKDKLSSKEFPTTNNLIENIAGNNKDIQATIIEQAQSAYPIMHTDVKTLITNFLAYKKAYGSILEKELYKKMTPLLFIDRLLTQRPLAFLTSNDSYLLRDGKTQGSSGFRKIGSTVERAPLVLEKYLSYDEMQIAALIGVSVPTYFINNGNRDNKGKKDYPGTYEKTGIYYGLVGARFEKPFVMEYQHMIITPEQNTREKGYGAGNQSNKLLTLWSTFYGKPLQTFDYVQEAVKKNSTNYTFLGEETYLDNEIYKKRLSFVIQPFLLDANLRGNTAGKHIYIHAVGLGLGVWAIDNKVQAQLMLDVYVAIIEKNTLNWISDIDFSGFPEGVTDSLGKLQDGQPFNGITIHFSKRNPADPLKDKSKLLCASYAWNGNSYPGNEYWLGSLNASGDPAAACCSTIPQLQNPQINTNNVAGYKIKTYPQ